jgi:hypothetical protein
MLKFPFIVEHNVFEKRANFLQIPIKMGKFQFIVEHKVFDKRESFLQIPIKMGKFLKKWESSHLLLNT